jgi:hypothetical protein
MVVQDTFGKIFNEGTEFQRDGSQFDALFKDGDTYKIGTMQAFAMYTPGHTPACMVHVMGNAAFVGDTLFMPDGGSARADFPGGDAGTLYDSIQKVLDLPDEMRLFMCHDYGPNGRDIQWETTVGDEKAHNIHVGGGKTPRGLHQVPHRARCPAGHAAADHPVAAGQHARRRHPDRQGWTRDAEGARQRTLTGPVAASNDTGQAANHGLDESSHGYQEDQPRALGQPANRPGRYGRVEEGGLPFDHLQPARRRRQ